MPSRIPIAVLSSKVAEQVAAGEVIQRPGDAVKELVENAIDAVLQRRSSEPDARCGTIQIELRTGGLETIRVVDDGCGIPAAELELALSRHGTSKLRHLGDLERVSTLGFRGEALPSIGAVAELTVLSRPPEAAVGALARMKGGLLVERGVRGCPVGTQVTARGIFQATPARLAFQRSAAGESAHVAHMVGVYAQAHPELRFELMVDTRRALQVGGGTLLEVFGGVYGPAAAAAALPVAFSDPAGVAVTGLISAPDVTRGRRGDILLYVNGRPIQNRSLTHAVIDAYRGFLPEARFPLVALTIAVDPAEVDVNVHPAKVEVRFRRDRLVYATLQRAVRAALLAEAPAPAVSAPLRAPNAAGGWSPLPSTPAGEWATPPYARLPGIEPLRPTTLARPWASVAEANAASSGAGVGVVSAGAGSASAEEAGRHATGGAVAPDGAAARSGSATATGPGEVGASTAGDGGLAAPSSAVPGNGNRSASAPQGASVAAGNDATNGVQGPSSQGVGARLPILRIVGQVQGTYIVCEGPDGVYFIDQHAAHERVLYEDVIAQRLAGGIGRQQLLQPTVVDLTPTRRALLAEHAGSLEKLGLDVEPFDGESALIRAIPAGLERANPARLLDELLDAVANPTPTVDGLDRAAATVACHAAVRAGDILEPRIMRELIQRLELTDVSRFCPHGRPTVVRLPASQLERDFGRR